MTFNARLMIRMWLKSIFAYHTTGARFTVKRICFVLFFPLWFLFQETLTWICLFLDEIFFPGYRRIVVDKPLFVLGFPRGGTTFLHRLIHKDEKQFTSLKLWEILFAPSIFQKKFFLLLGKADRLIGKPLYRLAVAIENRMFAGSRTMHRLSHFEPEEDEIILMHIFSSLFLLFMFPFEEMEPFSRFDTDISPKQKKAIMGFYKKCVQRHLYVFGPEKHFLSKNPASSSKINAIYETFPDARIVCIVRTPFEAVPSAISWISYGFYRFNTADQAVVTQRVLSLISHWYTYPLKHLDRRPPSCQAVETYDRMMADPGGFVKALYARFGYPLSDPYRLLLAQETERAKNYKSKHVYSLEQYGLTREKIVSDFAPVFERFDFSKDDR
jgi:omega-hydroxy-beta-dihydromenaquinone-9 sulfotransferase